MRDDYTDDWYDALNFDEEWHTYYFTVPDKDGDLYITAETYTADILEDECVFESSDESAYYPDYTMIIYKANDTDQEFKKIRVSR